MRRPALFLAAILFFAVVVVLWSQQNPTFSVDVKVVSLLATVRNKQGLIVRDLNKDDFLLEDDGRPQTIGYFSRETDLPLTIGLLVDTSFSQGKVIDRERGASYRFLEQVLRESKDQAFIIHFEVGVELLQDTTSSRQKLEAALELVDTPSRRQPSGAGTALYDAVYLASNELMKKQSGRKALILLTDGVDNSSLETLDSAIEAAQRTNTLIYSILFSDASYYGGGLGFQPNGKRVLQRLSKETGAHPILKSRKNSRSKRSSASLKKNFATSTVSATLPRRRIPARISIRFASP